MLNYLKTKTKGVELFYRLDNAKKPRANVVINHGFAEHIGRYDYLAKSLVDAGYNVLRYDLRGHGQSKGPKGYIESYNNFITDADSMVDLMKATNHDLSTFMLGHSMGGLVTTLYGINYPKKLDGQILSGAANGKIPGASSIMAKGLAVAAKFFPFKNLKNPVGKELCSVPEVVEAYFKDQLVLKSATFNFYNEFFNKATDDVIKNLDKYSLPVLVLHGKEDAIVPVTISENFYEKISSGNKELVIYPGLFHEIFNEKTKDEVIKKVISWLDDMVDTSNQ